MSVAIEYKSGEKIGEAIYLREEPKRQYSNGGGTFRWRRMATFLCRCGKEFISPILEVKRGKTSSCGCLALELLVKRTKTHGLSVGGKVTTEYQIFQGMKQRCYNKNADSYDRYGGRGIEICDRWLESVENFIEDMGKRPSMSLSVDRINNDGNYEPSNCKWSTVSQQARNRGNGALITHNGETKTVVEWSEITGIPAPILYYRRRMKWQDDIMFLPKLISRRIPVKEKVDSL